MSMWSSSIGVTEPIWKVEGGRTVVEGHVPHPRAIYPAACSLFQSSIFLGTEVLAETVTAVLA